MQQLIDFGAPVLPEDRAQALNASDLNGFYAAASDVDRLNLFLSFCPSFTRMKGNTPPLWPPTSAF